MTLPKPRIWFLALRPRTLTAAATPVIVGSAIAVHSGSFDGIAFLCAIFSALCLQIGSNLANDYYDHLKGADQINRLGPIRVTSAGLLTPREVVIGMVAAFAVAAVFGVYLISRGGTPILIIGILSIIVAVAYTGGPFPLGYNGLGDLFVFIFFGMFGTVGTFYVHTLTLTMTPFLVALPIACLVTNIIIVNNVRDVDTDRAVGKRTLAVLFGKNFARAEYAALAIIAYLTPIVLWALGGFTFAVFLPIITTHSAYRLIREIYTLEGAALNGVLGRTAQLLALYGALWAIGVAI